MDAFVKAVEAADANTSGADVAAWSEVRADIEAAGGDNIGALLKSASFGGNAEPRWTDLPWKVYKQLCQRTKIGLFGSTGTWSCLKGGGLVEGAYEIVFASVPQAEWDKGQAAANAWIRVHLPPDFALSEKRAQNLK